MQQGCECQKVVEIWRKWTFKQKTKVRNRRQPGNVDYYGFFFFVFLQAFLEICVFEQLFLDFSQSLRQNTSLTLESQSSDSLSPFTFMLKPCSTYI